MKMLFLRRTAALLGAALLCLTFTACGGSNDSALPVLQTDTTAALTETTVITAETTVPDTESAERKTVRRTSQTTAGTTSAETTSSAAASSQTAASSATSAQTAAPQSTAAPQTTVSARQTATARQTAATQKSTTSSTAKTTTTVQQIITTTVQSITTVSSSALTSAASSSETVSEVPPAEQLPLSGVRIGIDPGHQRKADTSQETMAPWSNQTKMKVTGGCAGVKTGIAEYVTVLEISFMLREKLQALGAEVFLTRESHDVNISNQERVKMLDAQNVDITLRIHTDSSTNQSLNGFAQYVSKSAQNAAQSLAYAQTIQPVVCEKTGAKNNGIYQNDNYTGQNWSAAPCIMVECGYMSNPNEDVLLNSADYQQKLTDGLAEGLVRCFQ